MHKNICWRNVFTNTISTIPHPHAIWTLFSTVHSWWCYHSCQHLGFWGSYFEWSILISYLSSFWSAAETICLSALYLYRGTTRAKLPISDKMQRWEIYGRDPWRDDGLVEETETGTLKSREWVWAEMSKDGNRGKKDKSSRQHHQRV